MVKYLELPLKYIADSTGLDYAVNVIIGSNAGTSAWYIDGIRFSINARYPAGNSFTVPITRFTTDSNTKLLIQSNLSNGGSGYNTFADTSGTSKSIAVTGAYHSTLYNGTENSVITPFAPWPANGKTFGSTGAYFDGTGDWLTVADSDELDWGTGDFTIDFWINMTSAPGNFYVCGMYTGGFGGLQFHTGGVNWYYASGTSVVFDWTSFAANTWYHIALSRSGTDLKFFVDGTQRGSTATSHNHDYSAGSTFYIGTMDDGGSYYPMVGYIDNFRISKGVARYTANFTPETQIYGSTETQTIPTITFTGAATQLAADEDIEFTAVENSGKPDDDRSFIDTNLGLTLTNLTGSDKSKATLTGTLASPAGTTYTNMPLKLQVRKTLGSASYDDSTAVTFTSFTISCGTTNTDATVTHSSATTPRAGMGISGTGIPADATILSVTSATAFELSANATGTATVTLTFTTLTTGLAPAMPVTGTGIPASTTITSVDSTTTLTLSAASTGGARTGQDLVFLDLTRVSHEKGGGDTISNADTMYTIATGTGGDIVLFNARRYYGTGATRSITGFGFQPDLIWIKQRGGTSNHTLYDSVRVIGKFLTTVDDRAESAVNASALTSFTQDGWTSGNEADINSASSNFISWGWKAGGVPSGVLVGSGATMSGTSGAGSIHDSATGVSNLNTLSQSISQTSGFSITKFTGTGNAGNFPHNLGGTPAFIIIKSFSGGTSWSVWHQNLASTSGSYLLLNSTAAQTTGSSTYWPTAPSSTLIYTGTSNSNGGYNAVNSICYAWKAVAGVSHFGSYTGTGANGLTVNDVGFLPRFLMVKNISNTSAWPMNDIFRSDQEELTEWIDASTSAAELSDSNYGVRFTSTGFTYDTGTQTSNKNATGDTYIYCAFA